jgi:polar amino acid transport system ATP-binding protein
LAGSGKLGKSRQEGVAQPGPVPESFAREVADRVIFMDEGVIVEQGDPAQVIGSPQHARTRTFLRRVLNPAAASLGEVPDTGPAPRVDREPAPEVPHPQGPGT